MMKIKDVIYECPIDTGEYNIHGIRVTFDWEKAHVTVVDETRSKSIYFDCEPETLRAISKGLSQAADKIDKAIERVNNVISEEKDSEMP